MKVNAYEVTYKRSGRLNREYFTSLQSAQTRADSHRANRRVAVSNPREVLMTVKTIG